MEKELEKKIIRKGIFIFLIVGTIFGSIAGVTAYTISAKEIGYSPKDSSWKVNNVADAIESLKTLKGGSTNYSTEEQVVGTWIDGKPVYQKTFFKDNLVGGVSIIESNFVSNNNVARVINIDALLSNANNKSFSSIANDVLSEQYICVNNDGDIEFKKSTTSSSSWEVTVTLQYTKTTDSVQSS